MRRIVAGLALGAAVGALWARPADAQAPAAGRLRITVPAVQAPSPAMPEATPALVGLKVRAARATRADYGPFALGSPGSEDIDLPAGSYVAFGARLRKAACPAATFEVKAGRRMALTFERTAPAGGALVCTVRVSAGP